MNSSQQWWADLAEITATSLWHPTLTPSLLYSACVSCSNVVSFFFALLILLAVWPVYNPSNPDVFSLVRCRWWENFERIAEKGRHSVLYKKKKQKLYCWFQVVCTAKSSLPITFTHTDTHQIRYQAPSSPCLAPDLMEVRQCDLGSESGFPPCMGHYDWRKEREGRPGPS